MAYFFGVEIEIIAEPLAPWPILTRAGYYEQLASALRTLGLPAAADSLQDRYRKHPEHYNKWWITKDGSLGNPNHPAIPLEAVSPTLSTASPWPLTLTTFFLALSSTFRLPLPRSPLCGSHVHISPAPARAFSLAQLRALAFGAVHFEPHVVTLLPPGRKQNAYCRPNSLQAAALRQQQQRGGGRLAGRVLWGRIAGLRGRRQVRDLVQASGEGRRRERCVLWNFDGAVVEEGGNGAVEFRGGRGLRGPGRVRRWVAFVVAFVNFCLGQRFDTWPEHMFNNVLSMEAFWQNILLAGHAAGVGVHLPPDWKVMPEMLWTAEDLVEGTDDPSFNLDQDPFAEKSDSDSGW